MKKLTYYAIVVIFSFSLACGGGATEDQIEETDKEVMEAVDQALQEMDDAMDEDEHMFEKEITEAEIPQNVKEALMSQFPEAKIEEAEEITDNDGNVTYEIDIEMGDMDKELLFGADGSFIGEQVDDEDGDDEVGDEDEDDE